MYEKTLFLPAPNTRKSEGSNGALGYNHIYHPVLSPFFPVSSSSFQIPATASGEKEILTSVKPAKSDVVRQRMTWGQQEPKLKCVDVKVTWAHCKIWDVADYDFKKRFLAFSTRSRDTLQKKRCKYLKNQRVSLDFVHHHQHYPQFQNQRWQNTSQPGNLTQFCTNKI